MPPTAKPTQERDGRGRQPDRQRDRRRRDDAREEVAAEVVGPEEVRRRGRQQAVLQPDVRRRRAKQRARTRRRSTAAGRTTRARRSPLRRQAPQRALTDAVPSRTRGSAHRVRPTSAASVTASVATAPTQRQREDDRVVAREDRVEVERAPRPGQAKIRSMITLPERRAGQDEPEQRDQRQERVAEGVLSTGPRRRESPRAARRQDVVARRAPRRLPARTSRATERERAVRQADDRQGEVREPVGQPGQARRRRVETRRRRAAATAACTEKSVWQQQRRPEGQAVEYRAKSAAPEIRSKALSGRPPASTPSGIAMRERQQQREAVQGQRVRAAPRGCASDDRPVVHEGLPQVEPDDPPDPLAEPLRKRPVEPVEPAHLRRGRVPDTRRPDSPPSAVTGLPGARWSSRKTSTTMPARVGTAQSEPPSRRSGSRSAVRVRPPCRRPRPDPENPSGEVARPATSLREGVLRRGVRRRRRPARRRGRSRGGGDRSGSLRLVASPAAPRPSGGPPRRCE